MNKTDLKLEMVMSAYKGASRGCRCGCLGTYHYTKANQAIASENRGYPVTEEDINDAAVKRAFNKIQKNWNLCEVNSQYIDLVIGKTATTLYLVPTK